MANVPLVLFLKNTVEGLLSTKLVILQGKMDCVHVIFYCFINQVCLHKVKILMV